MRIPKPAIDYLRNMPTRSAETPGVEHPSSPKHKPLNLLQRRHASLSRVSQFRGNFQDIGGVLGPAVSNVLGTLILDSL